jgi:hypothetical protein
MLPAVARLPRSYRLLLLAAATSALGLGLYSAFPHPFESVPETAIRLQHTHGIVIGYGHPSTFFVPPYQASDAVIADMKMTSVDPRNVQPALEGIEEALQAYPPGFVSALVKAIFVAGDLRVGSQLAGGSVGPAWFILGAPDHLNARDTRLTALVGVHHELSSFVMHAAGVEREWEAFAAAPSSFSATSEAALAQADGPDPAPETGYLSAYSATSAENDFNVYAEKIFTQPERLVRLACDQALVRKKLLFVLEAYVKLDARMNGVLRAQGIDKALSCAH